MTWSARIVRVEPAFSGVIDLTVDFTDGKATHRQHVTVEAHVTEPDVREVLRNTLAALAPSLDAAAAHQALIGIEETV